MRRTSAIASAAARRSFCAIRTRMRATFASTSSGSRAISASSCASAGGSSPFFAAHSASRMRTEAGGALTRASSLAASS
jgi:hypothetical protein